MDLLKDVFSILAGISVCCSFLIQLSKYKKKVRLARSTERKKILAVNANKQTPLAIEKRDILNLFWGMSFLILALANLALFQFGPEASNLLTAGDASRIAVSMILAGAGYLTLRG